MNKKRERDEPDDQLLEKVFDILKDQFQPYDERKQPGVVTAVLYGISRELKMVTSGVDHTLSKIKDIDIDVVRQRKKMDNMDDKINNVEDQLERIEKLLLAIQQHQFQIQYQQSIFPNQLIPAHPSANMQMKALLDLVQQKK